LALSPVIGCSIRTPNAPDPDQAVIDQLVSVHSDLRKPHQFDFYIYTSTKLAATNTASKLQKGGLTTIDIPGATGSNWLCLASKTIIPDKQRIHDIQTLVSTTAKEFGGDYDGWESNVRK